MSDGVSPRKKSRVEKKKRVELDDEDDDQPTTSRRSRPVKTEKSPERKRKGNKKDKSKEGEAAEPDANKYHIDASFQEDDDDDEVIDPLANGVASEDGIDEDDGIESYNNFIQGAVEEENAMSRMANATDEDCFLVPSRDDDLLFAGGLGYKIDEVMDAVQAEAELLAFEDEIQAHRWRCLYERFPAFFALVRTPSDGSRMDLSPSLRDRMITVLCLTYSHMSAHLKRVLGRVCDGAMNKKLRAKCRDMSDHVLMLVYLLYKLICISEDEAKKSKGKKTKPKGKGKGRGKKGKAAQQNEDDDMGVISPGEDEEAAGGAEDESSWEENRNKVLETLTEMANITVVDSDGKTCDAALLFLWKAGTANTQALSPYLNCALKFLENPDIVKPQSKVTLTWVFKLVRALHVTFKQYTFIGSSLFLKLLYLEYYQGATSPSAYPFLERMKAVTVGPQDQFYERMLDAMLVYFNRMEITVANSNAKALCLFINCISETEPRTVFHNISPFVALLSDENASVRSAVLNMSLKLLEADFLDPLVKPLADKFIAGRKFLFGKLLEHVRDINANVRATALKCLTTMARNKKIPISMINDGLVQLVGQRISDDKVAVRKEAVRFVTVFLEYNPYGHDLDRITVEKNLKEAIQKRDAVRKVQKETASNATNNALKMFNSFKDILGDQVEVHVRELLNDVFSCPDADQRKKFYIDFRERQARRTLGEDHVFNEDEVEMHPEFGPHKPPNNSSLSPRWLYTLILSEESENPDVRDPARLLVSMALNNDLKMEHVTKSLVAKKVKENDFPGLSHMILEAGRLLFVHAATLIIEKNDDARLKAEHEMARRKEKDKKLSKDINDYVMKLVLEHEFAQCLPAVMSSVMTGEGGDLKLGIDFVVKCKEFGITGSDSAVRQLCALVWKSDEDGRNQILQAASSMFISNHHIPKVRDESTCQNILNLVKSMSDHERGSVEQVLALTTKYQPIPDGVYDRLWRSVDEESIGKPGRTESKKQRQLIAMKALCLLSRSDVVRNRKWLRKFQNIVKKGSPEIVGEALGCIANLASTKEERDKQPYRIPARDSLFRTIEQFILAEIAREESTTWNRSLRATLDIYFHICMDTCLVIGGFVGKVMWMLRRTSQALHYYDHQKEGGSSRVNVDGYLKEIIAEERAVTMNRLWILLVERLNVVTSEIATRLLVHADYVFVREFNNAKKRMVEPVAFPKRPLLDWEVQSALKKGIFAWGTGDSQDIAITGLTEDERIHIMARSMIDKRLLAYNQLLGRLLPIVVYSVRAKGSPARVKFQGMNALSKIMLVSPHIAMWGARTFFTFLNNAPSPILRSNLTVCAADLTYRHPNLVENYANQLFSQLIDSDSCVRETCVLILNHLISNDLIKTHTVLAFALMGYIDPTQSIQHLTKGLFHEWSKKEGVMNHVPSFITQVSADARTLSLEGFKKIMDNFIPLIRERKDADSLIQKLAYRLKYAKHAICRVRNPDMPAYFTYCMSQCALTTKSFHQLMDLFEYVQPHLQDERVYNDITGIVKAFQKEDQKTHGSHSDLGEEISEFLRRLAEEHEALKNEKDVMGMVAKMQLSKKPTRPAPLSPKKAAGKGRARPPSAAPSTPTRARPKRAGGRKRAVYSSSEEDSD